MSTDIYNGGVIGAIPSGRSGVWGVGDYGITYSQFSVVTPSVVQNADLWIDASDLTTITESGGAVSQWDNKGTLTSNFTQASGALQPTTGATTFNGLNVIDFAGDYMVSTDTNEWKFFHDGTKVVWVAVMKIGVVEDPNAFYNVLATANSVLNVGTRIGYDDRSPTNNLARIDVFNAQGSPFVTNEASGLWAANTFQIQSAVTDLTNATVGDRAELYVNNGAVQKNNTATGTASASNPSAAAHLGVAPSLTNAFTGSIAEMVIVSGADATESNRVIIRDYLNAKWGVY